MNSPAPGFSFVLVVAALTGFLSLGYEILWFRVLALAMWGLPAAFGMLLAAYLLGIAIGSRVAATLSARTAARFDPRVLRLLGLFVGLSSLAAAGVGPAFGALAKGHDWPLPLVLVGLSAILLGAILPLLCHFGIEPDASVGRRLSWVYFANIVGSTLGSFVTGFILLDMLSISRVGTVLLISGLIISFTILIRAPSGSKAINAVTGIVLLSLIAAAPVAMSSAWDRIYERLLFDEHDDGARRFVDIIENRDGVITTTNEGYVYGGGAYDGCINISLTNDSNGIFRAYAIPALKQQPRRVLMIGLASGSWARVIASLPGVEDLTVIEINRGYTELISRYPQVAGILKNPKVHIVIDDGRRWLNRHPAEHFDLVVMNTTWHWRSNVTNLLSLEMMNLVKAHLHPGGVFYFNSTFSHDVQKTAVTAFSHALRVNNFIAVSDSEISFDADQWQRTLTTAEIDGKRVLDTTTPDGQGMYESLMKFPESLRDDSPLNMMETRESLIEKTRDATVVTDDNMVIEWREMLHPPEGT